MKLFKVVAAVLLTLVLAALCFHLFRPSHWQEQQHVINSVKKPNSQFVAWNGLDVHVVEEGQGAPVLLLHGLGGSLYNWDKLVPLMNNDYRTIRFDLPGFGLSDVPVFENENLDLTAFYGQFMDFVMAQYCPDSCYIVGNSLGGMLSWLTVQRYPNKVKKMVLLTAAGYELNEVAAKVTKVFRNPMVKFALAKGYPPKLCVSDVHSVFYDTAKAEPFLYDRKYLLINKPGALNWMFTFAMNTNFPDSTLIKQINTPTLIIWGDKDAVIPYEHAAKFARDLPNDTFVTYQNCGHVPMMEMPKRTVSDIFWFFNDSTVQ